MKATRVSDLFHRLELELGQVPCTLSSAQERQLRDLKADYKNCVQLADWFATGLEKLNQEGYFDAIVPLLFAYKHDRAQKRFRDLGDYTRICILGISRQLWSQLELSDSNNAIDQGWKLASLVIETFPSTDPLILVLKREWLRQCDILESRARVSPRAPPGCCLSLSAA